MSWRRQRREEGGQNVVCEADLYTAFSIRTHCVLGVEQEDELYYRSRWLPIHFVLQTVMTRRVGNQVP